MKSGIRLLFIILYHIQHVCLCVWPIWSHDTIAQICMLYTKSGTPGFRHVRVPHCGRRSASHIQQCSIAGLYYIEVYITYLCLCVCITLHTQNVYTLSLKRLHCSIKYICAFCETVCRHIDDADADADTRWCRDPRCRNWVLTGLRSVAFGANGKCGVECLMRNLIWAICVRRTLRITRCAPLVGVLCWRQGWRWRWWCVKRFHDTYLRSWWDAMRRQRANCEGVMSERTANRILVR